MRLHESGISKQLNAATGNSENYSMLDDLPILRFKFFEMRK